MSDTRLRRMLSRVCTARAIERIVDPILADIESEPHRPRWRGYLELARALALHTATSMPRAMRGPAESNRAALLHAAGVSMVVAVIAALLLLALPWLALVARGVSASPMVYLLPAELAITMPLALLVALPLAFRRVVVDRRVVALSLGLAAFYVVFVFALVGWVVPEANQRYRVATSGNAGISRGPGEKTLPELRRDMRVLRTYRGGDVAVRRSDFNYQSRIAVILSPLPTALLALALAASMPGRRRPLLTGIAGVFVYIGAIVLLRRSIPAAVLADPGVPVQLLAWMPNLAIGLAGAVALYFRTMETPARL